MHQKEGVGTQTVLHTLLKGSVCTYLKTLVRNLMKNIPAEKNYEHLIPSEIIIPK